MPPEGSESSTEEEVLSFIPFARSPLKGKSGGENQFTIAEGTENVCSLHFRLEDLSKYVTDRISLQVISTNSAVEVHGVGDSTVIFALCNSVQVDADLDNFFF